jgi:hypothetical protein
MLIEDSWREYARLQHQLANATVVSERTFGMEGGLDAIVEGIACGTPLNEFDVTRSIETTRRRERYRAARRHLLLDVDADAAPSPEQVACVADELSSVRAVVTHEEWLLLWRLAQGHGYALLAKQRGTTEGALRVKVKRLRDRVAGQLSLTSEFGNRRAA